MAMPPPPPAPPMSHSRFEEGLRPGGPPNDEVSVFVVFMNVISTVTHLLLGAVAVTAFIAINATSTLSFRTLTAHVYISVIGYVLVLSQAVLAFNPHMGWANNFKYPQKRKIYWIIQVVGSTMAVIGGALGIAAVEKYANSGVPSLPDWFPIPIVIEKYSHLSTSHGIVVPGSGCEAEVQSRTVWCARGGAEGAAGAARDTDCAGMRPLARRSCVPSRCSTRPPVKTAVVNAPPSVSDPQQRVTRHQSHTAQNVRDRSYADGACADKLNNCALAVQARLCHYPYYADYCCKSCNGRYKQ